MHTKSFNAVVAECRAVASIVEWPSAKILNGCSVVSSEVSKECERDRKAFGRVILLRTFDESKGKIPAPLHPP